MTLFYFVDIFAKQILNGFILSIFEICTYIYVFFGNYKQHGHFLDFYLYLNAVLNLIIFSLSFQVC